MNSIKAVHCMKALVFYGVGDIRFEADWPEPKAPREGEVTIETLWCGICGTDIEDYRYGGVIPVDHPHPISGRMAPLVLGHEYVGRVAAMGEGVAGLRIGQPVAIECVRACGKCHWCQKQQFAQCENMVSIGQQDDGGMAEFFNVPAENCIPIPEGDSAPYALAEPMAVMIRAMRKGRVRLGDTVAVVGAGAIGLCGIAAASIAGAERVISVNHGGPRAEAAKKLGATHSFDSREEGWMEGFLELTDGLKADAVIDTGGNIPAMRLAYDLTGRGGRCVIASVVNQDICLPSLDILLNEREVIGAVAHSHLEEYKWAVQYIADGRFDPSPLITGRIALEDALERGIRKSIEDRSQIKILVTPRRELLSAE